jgi:DNA repair protein SbcC/Rad50
VIPIELELKNFLAYQDPGTLNLEGVHIACLAGPNGAGKSSLLDAITWVLWGKARSNTPDELVHQGKENMHVRLVFLYENQRYQVLRKRKTGKRGTSLLELQILDPETNSWKSISEATIRTTQARIDGLMRLDYDTFVNSAFLLQGRADEFTTKTPGQRKQVLAGILGLSQWEIFERRARERISDTRGALSRLEGRLDEIERELARKESYQAELEASEKEAHKSAERLDAAEKQWSGLEQIRSRLVTLQRQIDDLTRRIETTRKEISETARERDNLLARADEVALQAALEQVQKDLVALDDQQAKADQLKNERQSKAEETANLRGVNQALGPETEPLKVRTTVLQDATEPICPTCSQPLEDEHRHRLISELKLEIESRREQYRKNQVHIREYEEGLAALDQEYAKLIEPLKAKTGLQKRAGELHAAMEHAADAARMVSSLKERLVRWEKEITDDEKQRDSLEKEADESELQLREAALSQRDIDQLRLEKRMGDERVGGARQQLAALDSLEEKRSQIQQEHTENADHLGLYEDLREAFSKRGVPAMIIETAVPELEQLANELLNRMTDGRMHVRVETQREIKTGEVREALDIIISDELGSRPYELYSGGEAFRINFAIRIALSRLLARRAGAQLRSLFIDEGFGTQDARGREHLISAINSIQDDFDRILVITHIDELKNAFPTRIEIQKSEQGSQFEIR